MKFNFVFVLIALICLYIGLNIDAMITFVGLPPLGSLKIFFQIFFFVLMALCFPAMVKA